MPEFMFEQAKTRRRHNVSGGVQAIIARYLTIVHHTRAELRQQFSDNELGLILDACNGIAFMDRVSVSLLPAGIEDAIQLDWLDRKWKVDGAALLEKLNTTTFAERMVLVDAIQVWWNRVASGEQPEHGEMLAPIGNANLIML